MNGWDMIGFFGWIFLFALLWVGFIDVQKRDWISATVIGVIAMASTAVVITFALHLLGFVP